jgi:DNA ligase (NAD+)
VLPEEGVKEVKESPISGKVFVFTGALESMTRERASKIVEGLGGRVSSSVSSNTDFVVFGKDAGSKLEKAKKLGVKTISEDEFLNLTKCSG